MSVPLEQHSGHGVGEGVRSESVGFLMNRMVGDVPWTAVVTLFHIGSVSHHS